MTKKQSKLLNKAQVLGGIKKTEKVHIEALQGSVEIRPLSQFEYLQIEEIETAYIGKIKATQDVDKVLENTTIDIADVTQAEYEARNKALLWGMNYEGIEDKWTEEDIQKLPKQAAIQIFEKIKEISLVDEASVKKFLENTGG